MRLLGISSAGRMNLISVITQKRKHSVRKRGILKTDPFVVFLGKTTNYRKESKIQLRKDSHEQVVDINLPPNEPPPGQKPPENNYSGQKSPRSHLPYRKKPPSGAREPGIKGVK